MEACDFGLLLVSPAFLASQFITKEELQYLLKYKRVIPVALKSVLFDGTMNLKGLEDRQIKLGCVQPGETSGTFGDALRKLADQATYLYVDGSRYWYSCCHSWSRRVDGAQEVQEAFRRIDLG